MRPRRAGVGDDGVEQGLGHASPPGPPVHADVVDVAAVDAAGIRREHGADERPAGDLLAVDVDGGDPPVVPPVPRVLPQTLDELGEALAVGVEVVGEGLLEHLVHGLQVLRDRQAVVVLGHPAHGDALAGWRQGARLGLRRGTGRLICSQVRVCRYPAAVSHPRCRRVRGIRAGVQLGAGQVALLRDSERGLLGPGEQRPGGVVGFGQAGRHGDVDDRATGRPVVDAGPGHHLAGSVLDDDLAAGPRGRARHGRGDRGGVHRARAPGGLLVGGDQGDDGLVVLEAGDPARQALGQVRHGGVCAGFSHRASLAGRRSAVLAPSAPALPPAPPQPRSGAAKDPVAGGPAVR